MFIFVCVRERVCKDVRFSSKREMESRETIKIVNIKMW
jgi:hypothetical protein